MAAARRVRPTVLARAILRMFGMADRGTVHISTDSKGAVRIEARQTFDETQLERMGPVRLMTEEEEPE